MQSMVALCAAASALIAGTIGGCGVHGWWTQAAHRRAALSSLGAASPLEAASVSLECEGVSARVLEYVVRLSQRGQGLNVAGAARRGAAGLDDAVRKAGLADAVSLEGIVQARLRLALCCAACGLIVGAVFSGVLALVGLAAGFAFGWTAVVRALREEARSRCFVAERQLSQMIEVVSLGLKSGMSFDRALSLYCQRFDGSLSAALTLAQRQWSHGLVERDEALRRIAQTYDSPLFSRFAENVIRSLRFGTSLADGLAALAVEARAVRKAKLEERVAKAPVKMLLPVGTLILPAMLILILGPVMLDLMEGV